MNPWCSHKLAKTKSCFKGSRQFILLGKKLVPFKNSNQEQFSKVFFTLKHDKMVFCWNNCSGYSQEKCFKCNLVFPKLSRLKKGQRVKGFWSQGRKKGTEGKVFEAEAVGRGWEMFPEVPFFLPRLQNVYELPFFFQPRCLGINQITRESFSP